jgi:hypothetical protein
LYLSTHLLSAVVFTPRPLSFHPNSKTVISTKAAHALCERRSGEICLARSQTTAQLFLLLQVPAVILSAAKDPEELTPRSTEPKSRAQRDKDQTAHSIEVVSH